MSKSSYSMGMMIILVGIVILFGKLGVLSFLGILFWPLLVIALGIVFHILYFGRILPAGVLIPAGLLMTYGLLFLYCNVFGWASMGYLWPGFILGAAVGLYEFYLFDSNQPKGAMIAAIILAVASCLFFSFTLFFTGAIYVIAFGLIAAGLVVMVRRPKSW